MEQNGAMKAINTKRKQNQVARKKTKLVSWVKKKQKQISENTEPARTICVIFGLWYDTSHREHRLDEL